MNIKQFFNLNKPKNKPCQSNLDKELEEFNREKNTLDNEKDVKIDDVSISNNFPKLDPSALHGLIGKCVDTICSCTESLSVALAVEIMSFLSISIPRGSVYLPYGAATTEPRLNGIVVAATGEGKGVSTRQFQYIRERINDLNADLMCPVFTGNLSTPEGLIALIRDENPDKPLNDSDIVDSVGSQLLIIAEEMSKIFNLANNTKTNISPLLRELFDGAKVSPLTKRNQISCEKPHVAFFGHITEQELHLVVKDIDIYNGFFNRFPVFIAMREKSIPFPTEIPQDKIDMLAHEFIDIIEWVKAKEHKMEYSDCFKNLWESEYENLRSLGQVNSVESALLSRATHYALMYAMIFAVIDKTEVISELHLRAALSWVDYWHESVKYTYKTANKKLKLTELEDKGERVLDVIKREIQASGKNSIGKTPITKAFSGSIGAKEISEIIEHLANLPTPKIRVEYLPRNALKISLC